MYDRQYAEMSSSSGVLAEDVLSFGNSSELRQQRAVFGCENQETGDLYSQRADGIMGLGRGDLSIVDQLVEKGLINDSFSLCYGGMDIGGGAMVLGGISPPIDMVFTQSDPVRRCVLCEQISLIDIRHPCILFIFFLLTNTFDSHIYSSFGMATVHTTILI